MSSVKGSVNIAKYIRDHLFDVVKNKQTIDKIDLDYVMFTQKDYVNAQLELYHIISKHPNVIKDELIKAVINFKNFLEDQNYSLLLGNYTSLIQIFCNIDCEELFNRILCELNLKKLQIKNKVYSPILHFYCRNNRYIDAQILFEKMEELDIVVENDYINILKLFVGATAPFQQQFNNLLNKYIDRFPVPPHEGIIEVLRATRVDIVNDYHSHKCSHCNCLLQKLDNKFLRKQLLESIDTHVMNTCYGKDENKLNKMTIENGQNIWRQFTNMIVKTKIDYVVDFFNVNCKFIPQYLETKEVNIHEFRKILNNNRLKGKKVLFPVAAYHYEKNTFIKFLQMCKREFINVVFFQVPSGYNDDWYWLYASLYHNAFLLTEDNCKDHKSDLWNKEENQFFCTWKNDHVVKVKKDKNIYSLKFPKPYSERFQISSLRSKIHFLINRKWYCANL